MASEPGVERVRRVLPARIRAAGWHTLRAVRRPTPGLLMRYVAADAPSPAPLAEGYELRQCRPDDRDAWQALLSASGAFGGWTRERFEIETRGLVAATQYFVEHEGELVAGTGAYARTLAGRDALEIGWVVRHPAHVGMGLGAATAAAATASAYEQAAGRTIFLYTDDHRLTAIALYLRMGFAPDLTSHRSYARRWEVALAAITRRGEAPAQASEQRPAVLAEHDSTDGQP